MSSLQQLTQSPHFKKIIIISFVTLSLIAWLCTQIYHHYYVSTDDAYINANVVQIASRVSGNVMRVYVKNNQYVRRGDVLFDIDPESYQLAVNSAKAELNVAQAELENADTSEKRIMALVNKQFVSAQNRDNSVANFKIAAAKVERANAALAQASLNLHYTRITAPSNGWVTNFSLRAGDMVSANQPLFALISDDEFWIDANFKETEMAAIQPGQQAVIETDLYPHHPFAGTVESISGGAGAAFSLLPPQNATGNWVKVTQRIPVRIRVLNPDNRYPLRIGASVTATVHLTSVNKSA